MAIPLNHGEQGAVLALEWTPGSQGPTACEREHLAVYASLAAAALSRARAAAALREAAARDAAVLGAIRDGVLAVDDAGVVGALNEVGAAAMGQRREHLLGRRLSDVPGLAPLARTLAAAPSQVMDVVSLPRGDFTVRSQRYAGGVVATLRDVATEHTIAQRMVGSVAHYTFDQLVGQAPTLRDVVEDAKQIARSDIPVLICGESGTGKEVLAQAIHNASPRSAGPFLGINVTAIPRELLESELFGYEGGTFTGARSAGRAGKFELAGNGTLLLDEVGDMPLEMQSKLLRVLQERVVQRLGSARDIPVRARIIATTHHDLLDAVNAGRFRLDLYHRLCVCRLRLPALRERHDDVALLVDHHLRLYRERTGRRVRVAPELLAALQAHDWPGNVRELLNFLEGELGVLRDGSDVLRRIPPALQSRRPRARAAGSAAEPLL
ncbi:MAG TPA: sigma 54-interacting transcriptional regulator, partial [Anaeromyxobacteraceae bacterium]